MSPLIPTVAAGLVALPVAMWLRRPVFRLSVAGGADDRTVCPACGADPFGRWPGPRGRCTSCAGRIGPATFSLELVTAAFAAAFVWRFGPGPVGVVLAIIAAIGVAMAAADRASLRLPDRLLVPAIVVLGLGLALATAVGEWQPALRAVLAGLALSGTYLVLAVAAPGQFGLGDVKLALLLGGVLGWFGWPFVLVGACASFLLSAGYSLILLALRRITLRDHIPFGPFMLLGAAFVLLA